MFLAAEVTEGADVGDDEGNAELVFGANGAEGEAAILEGNAATPAVVAELGDLILEEAAAEVVAEAEGAIPAAAVELAIADQGADLIRARLEDGAGLGGKLREGDEELAIGAHADEPTVGGDFAALGIVVDEELGVVAAARDEAQIADDGRETAAGVGKGERCDGVERCKDIAAAGDERAAEGAVEIDFLDETPGEKFFGLGVAAAAKKALGDGVFELIGVCERIVFIHAEEAAEAVHAIDEAIEDLRLDGVLPASGGALPNVGERGRAEVHGDLGGGAVKGVSDHVDQGGISGGIGDDLRAVTSGSDEEGGRDAKPGPPAERNGDAGGELGALDDGRGLERRVAAVDTVGKGVEAEVDRPALPRGLVHGADVGLRGAAEYDGGFRVGVKEVLVVGIGEVEAEAAEIVCGEGGAADFGVDRFAEGFGESEAEGEGAEAIEVGDRAPAVRELGFELETNGVAALGEALAVEAAEAAVIHAVVFG